MTVYQEAQILLLAAAVVTLRDTCVKALSNGGLSQDKVIIDGLKLADEILTTLNMPHLVGVGKETA